MATDVGKTRATLCQRHTKHVGSFRALQAVQRNFLSSRCFSNRAIAARRWQQRQLERCVEVGAATQQQLDTLLDEQEETETFNWVKQWWPVQWLYNLDTDRPNKIKLLGKSFAVWKSKSGEWVAMRDMCPHRLAPLSEGRVEDDGTLMCSYHGWKFNECGKCVKIPQADDDKAHEAACNSSRSSAKTFPCKAYASMLWIWPDESESNSSEAKEATLPIPEDHAASMDRITEAGWKPGFTTVLPYSFDVLMENLVDPSHFPWSHHGTFFGTRDQAKPLKMQYTDPLFPNSLAAVDYDPLGMPPGRVEVVSPSSVLYQSGAFGPGKSWNRSFIFAVPLDDRTSRSLTLPFFSASFDKPSNSFLKFLPWLVHWANLDVIDGDNVFLHGQDQYLRGMGKKWSPDTYYMATSADLLVSTYRKWLETEGGGGPMRNKSDPSSLPRRELLDRYSSHTADCKICQGSLKLLTRISSVCKTVSQCCLLVAVSLFAHSLGGQLAHWKAALPLIPFCLFVLIEKQIRQKLIPKFHFTDYVHAEKN